MNPSETGPQHAEVMGGTRAPLRIETYTHGQALEHLPVRPRRYVAEAGNSTEIIESIDFYLPEGPSRRITVASV